MIAISLQNTFISEVNFTEIYYDPQVEKIIKSANPLAMCRNQKSDFNIDNIDGLLIAFPIVGYIKNERFSLCSGLFSFNTIAQTCKGNDRKISVIVFKKKPKPKEIRRLFLTYLVSQIVNQFYTSDSSQIGFFLNSWFIKDESKKSIQASKEWLSLFPYLNTTELLAKHMGISNRNLYRIKL
jgi:hypothetical protein